MSEEPSQVKKIVKRAAVAGFVLALLCPVLPPEYRPVCELIAKLCTGGLL